MTAKPDHYAAIEALTEARAGYLREAERLRDCAQALSEDIPFLRRYPEKCRLEIARCLETAKNEEAAAAAIQATIDHLRTITVP